MNTERKEQLEDKWKGLVRVAVTDDYFKEKLTEDPLAMMQEKGLLLPESIQVKVVNKNLITLIEPQDAPEDLVDEIKWWRIRLEMISEFGRDERGSSDIVAPEAEEGV